MSKIKFFSSDLGSSNDEYHIMALCPGCMEKRKLKARTEISMPPIPVHQGLLFDRLTVACAGVSFHIYVAKCTKCFDIWIAKNDCDI